MRTVAAKGQRVGRRTDAEYGRERKYLTPAEVDLLITTAKKRGRYGQRDALAILMCYRHGLRVSELVTLRWSQIAWEGTPRLTVERRKGSVSGVAQALDKDEVRLLRQLRREQPVGTSHIFQGERGAVDVDWFRRMLRRVGMECGLPLVHPHQLRHGCGYALADKGRDLREIQLQLRHKVDFEHGRLRRSSTRSARPNLRLIEREKLQYPTTFLLPRLDECRRNDKWTMIRLLMVFT